MSSPAVSADPEAESTAPASPSFADFGLDDRVMKALKDVGYETPSAIQAATIPTLLAGRDVVGLAQTGTGKTAAFALPILTRLDVAQRPRRPSCSPPRASSPCRSARRSSSSPRTARRARAAGLRRPGVRRAALGAAPRRPRRRRHARAASWTTSPRAPSTCRELKYLVLDEADEMLKMGFAEDVETILADTPDDKQVALFSATMPPQIRRISKQVPQRRRRDHGQAEDHHVGQHDAALPDGVVPAEGRRPDPHPRGRELRGHDRLRPHQERDRDPRREAARPRLLGRRHQRRRRAGAARAHGQPAEVGQARHPRRHRRRRPRPRRRAHQPRRQLRHPDRHRVLRAPHRPHRPRRPLRRRDQLRDAARAPPARPRSRRPPASRSPQMQLPSVGRRQRHPPHPLRRRDHGRPRAAGPHLARSATSSATTSSTTTCPRPTSPRRSPSSPRATSRCCFARRPTARSRSVARRPRCARRATATGPTAATAARATTGERPERRPGQADDAYRIEVGKRTGRAASDRRSPRQRGRPQPRRLRRASTSAPTSRIVELPADLSPDVLDQLSDTRISGKLIQIRPDNGPRRPRRDGDAGPGRKPRHR